MLKEIFLILIVFIGILSIPLVAGIESTESLCSKNKDTHALKIKLPSNNRSQVILEESFENLRLKKGWHILRGNIIGDHGVVWNTHKQGLELERGIVSNSSNGEVHAELDANRNVTISTRLRLKKARPYEISFDIKPRNNSNSCLQKSTSAMLMKIGRRVLKIRSNKTGKLSSKYSKKEMHVSTEFQKNGWTKFRIKLEDFDFKIQKFIIKGLGKNDSYGMLLDNINISYAKENKSNCATCLGKISRLTLKYQGKKNVLLEVKKKKGRIIFSKELKNNQNFILNGFDKKGTLGKKISFYLDGKIHTKIHTSCSKEILVGMVFGDFLITEGLSRNGGKLCKLDGYRALPPFALEQNLSLSEDTNLSFILETTDENTLDLNYTVLTYPSNGILSGIAPNLVYIPNANYHGVDSLSFLVNNGTFDSNIATVLLTIHSVNDAPVAKNDSSITNEDIEVVIDVLTNDSDLDGTIDASTLSIVDMPSEGTASISNGKVVYIPNTNYHGEDSFAFVVNDGIIDSNVSVINLSIASVNDIPIVKNKNFAITSGESIAIRLEGTDIDKDLLTYTLHSILHFRQITHSYHADNLPQSLRTRYS
jgi:hypothetical protein